MWQQRCINGFLDICDMYVLCVEISFFGKHVELVTNGRVPLIRGITRSTDQAHLTMHKMGPAQIGACRVVPAYHLWSVEGTVYEQDVGSSRMYSMVLGSPLSICVGGVEGSCW